MSSSHGARCCFAQLIPLLSLLECRLTIWIQLNRVNWHTSRTPESQWGTRSPTLTRLCLQTVAYPTDTGRHLCFIAANRTPCRRNQRARLQSHTHGLLLPKESAHPCRSSSQCNRTCSYKPTALMQASVQHYPTEGLNTADTSCPSRTSAEHFDNRPGPCPENERSHPCTNVAEPATWSTDRIEYNWLQRMHLLTDSLCTATWCLCTEPLLNIQLSWQLRLKELHACKPASMLSS